MEMLSLSRGGFRYPSGDKWVFHNVAFTVHEGECVRITGRNGSGKSTLLKVLSGLLQPTEGDLLVNLETHAVYMDQFSAEMLAPGLTISEHFKAATARTRVALPPIEAISRFGLDLHRRRNDFIGHLSGGERQIVALLCTLASGANLLCLDEFAASLDDRSAAAADALVEFARNEVNIAIVLVSHQGSTVAIQREFELETRGDTTQKGAI